MKPTKETKKQKETNEPISIPNLINRQDPKIQQVVNRKIDEFLNLRGGDLLAFFDFMNAIAINAKYYVTSNPIIIDNRKKLQSGLKYLKILTIEEAQNMSKKEKAESENSYIG